ncbi:MAG: hypothetical protein ACRC6X_02140 [Culicoidibacterales bacterium]
MNARKGIIIAMVVAIIGAVGFGAYFLLNAPENVELKKVDVLNIENEQTRIILSGTVQTKESESFTYDYATYGKHQSTPVSLGQYVNKDDIIVESTKKDYKAPFNGYIAELNVDNAYKQAKEAADDSIFLTKPEVLYTIISSDYYIDTRVTEYEITRLPKNQLITYSIRAQDANLYYDASVKLLAGLPIVESPGVGTGSQSDISYYRLTLNMNTGKEQARVGNHVTIRIEDKDHKALIIPQSATIREENRVFVYLFKANEATKLEITGKNVETGFQVETGLATGEQIITSDVPNLTNGEKVEKK